MQILPEPGWSGRVVVIVSPHGADAYPQYLVKFDYVPAYTCIDESTAPSKYVVHTEVPNRSCYIWDNSPWKDEFKECSEILLATFGVSFADLKHYVFFGGDNIVEVLSGADPKIEEIGSRRVIGVFEV